MKTRSMQSRRVRVLDAAVATILICLSVGIASAQTITDVRQSVRTYDQHPSLRTYFMNDATDDVRPAQGPGIDVAQVRRWAELFAFILGEFKADDRDPTGRIEGDFSVRMIRIVGANDREAGVTRTLTANELAKDDLRELAKRLYADSKKPTRD